MAVGVGAADEEGVFLGEAEAGGGLAGAGEGWWGGRVLLKEGEEGGCPVGEGDQALWSGMGEEGKGGYWRGVNSRKNGGGGLKGIDAGMSYSRINRAFDEVETHLVAIPEHRANVFKATRSPRRTFRIGPRTVAQCLIGSNVSPSRMCHSTLDGCQQQACEETQRQSGTVKGGGRRDVLAIQLPENLVKERNTGEHTLQYQRRQKGG